MNMDSKRGTPVILLVLIVLSLLLTSVYFREGDRGPLHYARDVVLAASSPITTVGEWVASPFRSTGEWFSGIGVSRSEVQELRDQNTELRDRLAELEEARLENERLRVLVGFAEEAGYEYLGVRIIGRPINSWEGTVRVDRGSEDGVEPGMPVIVAQGLLGQVVEVSARSAKVQLITDQHSGVAAMVQLSRVTGVVSGSLEGAMILDFVPSDSAPSEGDVVITSGLGGVYPKGLVVGDVVFVSQERDLLFPLIRVESRVSIADIEEALVITGPLPELDLGAGE